MSALLSPRERRPVTLVHVMKKKLRGVLSPSTPTDTDFPTTINSLRNSPEAPALLSDGAASPSRQVGSSSTTNNNSNRNGSPTTQTGGAQVSRRVDPTITTSRVTSNATSPTTSSPAQRYPRPDALPTPDFYERFPRAVGPLANVVVTSHAEYTMLLRTAKTIRLVSTKLERNADQRRLCEEDVQKGGFLVYQPDSVDPQYFQLYDCAEDVYGSASYMSG